MELYDRLEIWISGSELLHRITKSPRKGIVTWRWDLSIPRKQRLPKFIPVELLRPAPKARSNCRAYHFFVWSICRPGSGLADTLCVHHHVRFKVFHHGESLATPDALKDEFLLMVVLEDMFSDKSRISSRDGIIGSHART
jgi:hypothetical protein